MNREFDPSRFRSLVNKKIFDEVESKDFIKEKIFYLKEGECLEIQNRIRELGWEQLCLLDVVREFHTYAFRG